VVVGDLFVRLALACGDKNTFVVFLSLERRLLAVRPELAWLVTILNNYSE
jgi:hypothetical protein